MLPQQPLNCEARNLFLISLEFSSNFTHSNAVFTFQRSWSSAGWDFNVFLLAASSSFLMYTMKHLILISSQLVKVSRFEESEASKKNFRWNLIFLIFAPFCERLTWYWFSNFSSHYFFLLLQRNCGGNMSGLAYSRRWEQLKCWPPSFSRLWRWFKRLQTASTNKSFCQRSSEFCSLLFLANRLKTESISVKPQTGWFSLHQSQFKRRWRC